MSSRSRSPSRRARSPSKRAHKARSPSRKSARSPSKARKMRKVRVVRKMSAFAKFAAHQRKMHPEWKQLAKEKGVSYIALTAPVIAKMWAETDSKARSAARKMKSPSRKMRVRKVRVVKRRALKKSGSPRRVRKDKGTKKSGAKKSAYQVWMSKHRAAMKAKMPNAKPQQIMAALGKAWSAQKHA
jgi:hypothetical protein